MKNGRRKASVFLHPFAAYGAPIENLDFHQYINKLNAEGKQLDIEDYSFPIQLAKKGGFAQPNPNQNNPLAQYSYAYHIDAVLYAKFLTEFSVKRGVDHILANVSEVKLNAENGFIQALTLDNGQHIEGDLFIDCRNLYSINVNYAP